ncbi:MAG: histidine phosphatase family protein [Pseudomonadota bacterium]
MPTTIILCRHGQTLFNRTARIQGQSDSPLTRTGLEETRKLAEMVCPKMPGVIYSSILGRAAYSSAIYSQILGIPLYFRQDIVELSCGEWETSLRTDVIGPDSSIRLSWVDRPPGGESYKDAEKRVCVFINELLKVSKPLCVMVLAHSGLNRVLVKTLLTLPSDQAMNIRFPHDTVYEINSDGDVNWIGLSTGRGRGFLGEKE